MKSRFIIFRFVLIYLLAISIAGCGRDKKAEEPVPQLTPMEKLIGEYRLVEFKSRIKDTTITVETPTVFGQLVLEMEEEYFSLTVVVTDDVNLLTDNGNAFFDSWKVDGDSWNADETDLRMTVNGRSNIGYNVFKYRYDETYLILEGA